MGVVALERRNASSEHRLGLGRQGLQVAALIAAQLPDHREDALAVLDHAIRIVRDWLETAELGPTAGFLASGGSEGVRNDSGK